jgi:hypothetical protein
MRYLVMFTMASLVAVHLGNASAAEPSLDYDFYQSRIEPLFLQKRVGHARCYTCHAESNNAFRLQKLSPGSDRWSAEQSRRNFETVSTLVVAGKPADSRLLMHPLAPEAGGSAFHNGGRQFGSKDDPDWKLLAQWASGEKLAPR